MRPGYPTVPGFARWPPASSRSADAINFPDQAGFAQFKAAGQLSSTSEAAKRVLAKLARPDFGQQAVADVRDSA
jgi:hypothetical protein